VNGGSDVVSSNVLVASRFDVQGNSGGTLEHPLAEGAFKIASAMGKGVLMLQYLDQERKKRREYNLHSKEPFRS
jgi:hypothetical protein